MGRVPKMHKSRAKKGTRSPVKIKSPVKRKKWTNEEMEAAIDAVKTEMGVNAAVRCHGVPKTTLENRISRRVVHGSKPGPRQYSKKKRNWCATFKMQLT